MPDQSLSPRDAAVYLQTVPRYIRLLKGFFGYERLARAQRLLDQELAHHGLCYRYIAMERRPWLFALRDYDALTLGGTRTLATYPLNVQLLAGAGLMLSHLYSCMSQAVREKYAADLLLDTFGDFSHELDMAWQYYRLGFFLAWYEPGQKRNPEFRVFGGGFDVDVECRRIATDFSERVKSSQVADTCDVVYRALAEENRWGDVDLEIRSGFRFDASLRKPWRRQLKDALRGGATQIELGPNLSLRWALKTDPSPEFTAAELEVMGRNKAADQFTCLCSKRRENVGFEPVLLRCRGPRRTAEELRDDLYAIFKDKVKLQLREDRPGLLAIKADGVIDPIVFNDSEGIQAILARLFKHRQLVAVIFRCDAVVEESVFTTVSNDSAVIFYNQNTAFPAMRTMPQFVPKAGG